MIEDCIRTWKLHLPEYEIKVWNMEMARGLNIDYVNEALDAKKWAFAGDVVRAYAVYKYGGIYMDTDIYVCQPFDKFLNNRLVFFHEKNDTYYQTLLNNHVIDEVGNRLDHDSSIEGMQIQAAFFMGEKGHPFLKKLIDYYRSIHFLNSDGAPNIKVIAPMIYAEQLESFGYKYKDVKQNLEEGILVETTRYVSSNRYYRFPETIAIHCINHSWKPKTFKEKLKVAVKKIIRWHDKAVVLPQY